jgi:hypothetical protein
MSVEYIASAFKVEEYAGRETNVKAGGKQTIRRHIPKGITQQNQSGKSIHIRIWEGKKPPGSSRRRWEDNNKMELRERIRCYDRIDLFQGRNQWRALVNTVMNLRVP